MKSNVEFLREAFSALCNDLGIPVLDTQLIDRRLMNEGLTFATEVLPRFSREIVGSIEAGSWSVSRDFSHHNTTVLPKFLGKYTSCIFDSKGSVLEPCPAQAQALYIIRQLCEYAYKADFPSSDAKNQLVIDSFIATESELRETPLFDEGNPPVLILAREIIRNTLFGYKPDVSGSYGPGVCSDASVPLKYNVDQFDSPAVREYSESYYPDHRDSLNSRVRMTHDSLWNNALKSKVILVPKDSRGPRLICAEPTTNQWLQMSLMSSLVRHLESSEWTSGYVNFTNQQVNRDLAKVNSLSRTQATLDLKDASDRVRLDLVDWLFSGTSLYKPLLACRTPMAVLPDGRQLKLAKFAPMGSAMCFPTLALTVWAISCAAISLRSGDLVTDCVYVYGDDLIVPTYLTDDVINALESCSLRVNRHKSFVDSHFRESCGEDRYFGLSVTPVRLRKVPSDDCCVKENAFRLVTHSNELDFLPCLQEYIRSYAEFTLGKPIAYSSAPIPGTFRVNKYDKRVTLNKKRYIISHTAHKGMYSDSDYSVLRRAFRRIGTDTQNGVSDIDLRGMDFSTRRITRSEWHEP